MFKKYLTLLTLALILTACGNEKDLTKVEETSEYEEIYEKYQDLSKEYSKLSKEYADLKSEYNKLTAVENDDVVIEDTEESIETTENANNIQYNSDLTYADLMRKPDNHEEEYVSFTGEVLQYDDSEEIHVGLRLAIDGNVDEVLLVGYYKSLIDYRLLEGDTITIKGEFRGLSSYTTVMGNEVTLPLIWADSVELQQK